MDVTDRIGDTVMKYRYDAFGNLFTQMAAPYNTVGFTGKSYDAKASLMDYSARWYSPNYGRFITEDTFFGELDLVQTLNRYAYVANNPINYLDPTGNYYWCYAVINGVEYSHAPPCDDDNNKYWIDEEDDGGGPSGGSGGSGNCTEPTLEELRALKESMMFGAAGMMPESNKGSVRAAGYKSTEEEMYDDGIVRKNGVLDREYYLNLYEQEGPDAIPASI